MSAHLIVLTGPKKCREDVSAAEDIIAIAHDDDLQMIEDVVCPSQMLERIPEVSLSSPP